jgi:hypothetical protein
MKGTKSDWLVYNLNLLFGQGFHPRSRAGLIFHHAAERPARALFLSSGFLNCCEPNEPAKENDRKQKG